MRKKILRTKKQCNCCDRPPTQDYITFYGKDDKPIHVCKECYMYGNKKREQRV